MHNLLTFPFRRTMNAAFWAENHASFDKNNLNKEFNFTNSILQLYKIRVFLLLYCTLKSPELDCCSMRGSTAND